MGQQKKEHINWLNEPCACGKEPEHTNGNCTEVKKKNDGD